MADINDVMTAVTHLGTAIDALIAKIPTPAPIPVSDTQPVVDALNALTAKIQDKANQLP